MSINLQPTLENDLVVLRPLEFKDFEALYQAAKDPKIWELHQNPYRWELHAFKDFFQGAMDSKSAFVIIDKATDSIIGSSRFKIPGSSMDAIEIGWTFLSRNYWGGLYNSSFKSLMITYAFEHFKHILFHVDHHNYRSQRAVNKLGGELLNRDGQLGHLHTTTRTGLTYILTKS